MRVRGQVTAGVIVLPSMGHRTLSIIRQSMVASALLGPIARGAGGLRSGPQRARRSTRPTSEPGAPRSGKRGRGRRRSARRAVAKPPRFTRSPKSSAALMRSRSRTKVADLIAAPALLERNVGARHILADKGYDADDLRSTIRDVGAVPAIPGRRTRAPPHPLRPHALQRAPTRRARLPQTDILSARRHPLRRARHELLFTIATLIAYNCD